MLFAGSLAFLITAGCLTLWGAGAFAPKQADTNAENQSSKELNIGLLLEPTNLNIKETSGVALDQVLLDNVYQGLITLKSGELNEFVPALATALPEVSADGRSYSFKLRSGVKFHNGAEFDSEDVISSLGNSLQKLTDLKNPQVTSSNPQEITVSLDEPNQLLLWYLAGRHGIIFDSKATNDLSHTANGTGPYQLSSWKQGHQLTLIPYTDYWGQKAQLSAVNFRFIPDARAAVNALKDGSLDVHTALLPHLRSEIENIRELQLTRAASTDVFTLAFNSKKAPFNDPEVRAALSQAINTKTVIASQAGDGKELGSPITDLEPGYLDLTAVNSYDPQTAKKTLAAKGLEKLELTITAPNFYDQAPLDIVASQLQEVGVQAKIERVEFSTWLERVYANGDFDLSYVDHAEARDFANYANPEYYFGYNNAAVQQLYTQAITAADSVSATNLLQETAKLVAADAPAKWLYNYTPTLVIRDRVTGFPVSNTNSRINLESVTIK